MLLLPFLYDHTFDSQGRRYDLPMYIFKDPDNMVDDISQLEDYDEDAIITFSVRPSNGMEDLDFELPVVTKVIELKAEISKQLNLDGLPDQLKLIYQGKMLQDHYTLAGPV